MNSFMEKMREDTNDARTLKGALSKESSLSAVLDFFSKSGSLRGREDILSQLFSKAMAEDKLLALKSLFYMRDIRGGQGERANFRVLLKYLASFYTQDLKENISIIPEYGRWDDLFCLLDTDLRNAVLDILKNQINTDWLNYKAGKEISLLAKWLPSENTSSKETKKLARDIIKAWDSSPKKYRKTLSVLRKYLNVVEQKMSSGQWGSINYEQVPSVASKNYSKAFGRNDTDRYVSYLEKVKKGEAKINAGTLYPYDIVRKIPTQGCYFKNTTSERTVINELWKALPNYIEKEEEALVVVDTSGSMYSGVSSVSPIMVALSLGIYISERNKGSFKDYFLTFSENPKIQKLQGVDFVEKVVNLSRADWGGTTNLQKSFDLILSTAIRNNVPEEEMPKKLYIVSDMQFDSATRFWGSEETNFEAIDRKYKEAGYERPTIVFWNVNASNTDQPVNKDENGTALVSGASPSILKYAVNSDTYTPETLMLEVLNSDRYDNIKLARKR